MILIRYPFQHIPAFLLCFFFFFFFFFNFMATAAACGCSQVRDWIWATAATYSITHSTRPGIKPTVHTDPSHWSQILNLLRHRGNYPIPIFMKKDVINKLAQWKRFQEKCFHFKRFLRGFLGFFFFFFWFGWVVFGFCFGCPSA